MEVFKNKFLMLMLFSTLSFSSFIDRHCIKGNNFLICYNFRLSESEKLDIQNRNFVLSLSKKVAFRSCNIGEINVNFFTKFPNAIEMSFTNSTISLKSSNKLTDYKTSNNLLLKNLYLISCKIENIRNTNAFKWLTNLENVLIYNIFFENHNTKLFENSKNLRILNITNGNSNIFVEEFQNLKSLTLRHQKIYEFDQKVFEKLYKLEILDLSRNFLIVVPNISSSIEYLNLDENLIEYININDFKNMINLKSLSLNKNRIKFIPLFAFDYAPKLTSLSLRHNNLSYFNISCVKKLRLLEYLDLEGNLISTKIVGLNIKTLLL